VFLNVVQNVLHERSIARTHFVQYQVVGGIRGQLVLGNEVLGDRVPVPWLHAHDTR
jgi:hypothetical protein